MWTACPLLLRLAGTHGSFLQRVLGGQPSQAATAAPGKKPWRGLPPKPAAKKPAIAAKNEPAARASQGPSTLDALTQQLRSPATKKAQQRAAAAHMERLAQQAVAAAAPEPLASLQAAEGQLAATELRANPGAGTDTAVAAEPHEVVSAEESPAQKRVGAAGEHEQACPP